MSYPVDIAGESLPELHAGQTVVGTTVVQVDTLGFPVHKRARLKSNATNTGKIYIGSTTSVSTGTGYQLAAGEYVEIPIDNLAKVYLISDTAAQVVSWLAV